MLSSNLEQLEDKGGGATVGGGGAEGGRVTDRCGGASVALAFAPVAT